MSTTTTGRVTGIAERYRTVRELTERLADPLSAEDQCIQSMADVSPTKWHRAHTTWFFETFVLGPHTAGYEAFDPAFAYLFNSYYEAVGPRHARTQRGVLSRPGIGDIAEYRHWVDTAVSSVFRSGTLSDDALALVELGLHHEQQHQELLLMDIKHVLAQSPLGPAYLDGISQPSDCAGSPSGWTPHEGGIVQIGHDGDGFSYDNETPRHRALVEPFELADGLVTSAQWIAFIDDGGYSRSDLWLSDGWAMVNAQEWTAPSYWRRGDDGWEVFTLGGWRAVAGSEPVCHVSYYEADAFARWAGARLPTEQEWELAAGWDPVGGGIDLAALHPRAASNDDDRQFFGQVWQWTSSAYLPFPGFTPAAGAVGEYNGKFMVNQHVLRGSSCVTPAGHTRPTYRNFFPPAARWPFTGLRLARS